MNGEDGTGGEAMEAEEGVGPESLLDVAGGASSRERAAKEHKKK